MGGVESEEVTETLFVVVIEADYDASLIVAEIKPVDFAATPGAHLDNALPFVAIGSNLHNTLASCSLL